jgi:hypothetical protein
MPGNRSRLAAAGALGAAALAAGGAAFAHHSSAMYENEKRLTLTGTVKSFQWTNPHATIVVEVPGANNALQQWDIEAGAPGALVRQGWKRSSFKAGDKVSVVVRPMRNGSAGGIFVSATLPDGAVLPRQG